MRWLEALLVQNLWLTLLIWIVLFVLDYTQTIRSAKLYQEVVKPYIVFEGSYELTLYFQPDIDLFRTVSVRLLKVLAVSIIGLSVEWWLVMLVGIPQLFSVLAGGLILRSLAVHHQHLRNMALFSYIRKNPDQLKGHVEYARPMLLRNSAADFEAFSGLYLAIFALTGSWFVAGGALSCLVIAAQMVSRRRKGIAQADKSAQTNLNGDVVQPSPS